MQWSCHDPASACAMVMGKAKSPSHTLMLAFSKGGYIFSLKSDLCIHARMNLIRIHYMGLGDSIHYTWLSTSKHKCKLSANFTAQHYFENASIAPQNF